MEYFLDTNICIYIIKKSPESIIKKFKSLRMGAIGISTITLAELRFGVANSLHKQKNQAALDEFISPIETVPFDDLAANHYGEIRSELQKKGIPIGPLDMMIAAHAMSLNVTLVTNNTKEFNRIAQLKVENWASL